MKLKHKKERKLNQKSKQQKYQNLNNKLQKGITLIALVITIIVLLILAGVSIATLTGDNGILTKAQIAKEETQKASKEEQRQLAILNASMNTEKYDYPVEDGKVKIPVGFAPTGIEGENSIKDGVVITDENGNEFVWVPVSTAIASTLEEAKRTGAMAVNTGSEDDPKYSAILYSYWESEVKAIISGQTMNGTGGYPSIFKEPADANFKDSSVGDKDLQEQYNKIIESIDKYGGFYVGRYKMGVDGSNSKKIVSKKSVTMANADSTSGGFNGWKGLYDVRTKFC